MDAVQFAFGSSRARFTGTLQVNRQTAERCTILRGLVGSTVHGLNVINGIEDRDEMGICVELLEEAMALLAPFEQFIYRSAAEREGRVDARSTAGDLDLTIYSLRKWTRLALKGNPTIMLLLFTPEEQLVCCDNLGAELRALTPSIVSRRVQGPFLGYLQAQKQRLTGERGQKRIHRPELEEMYGFDTKYAIASWCFGRIHLARHVKHASDLDAEVAQYRRSWLFRMVVEKDVEATTRSRDACINGSDNPRRFCGRFNRSGL